MTEHPCEFCGTPLDEDNTEESGIAAAGRVTHFAALCRERVHAALRATKRALIREGESNRALGEALRWTLDAIEHGPRPSDRGETDDDRRHERQYRTPRPGRHGPPCAMSGRNADIRISRLAVLLNSIATVVVPAQAGIQGQSHLGLSEWR